MNHTTSHPMSPARTRLAAATPPLGRVRMIAFTVAILACLPYLALKIIWIAGGEIGIPADSELLDPDQAGLLRIVNGFTVLMDSVVIGLALILTRPWGHKVPAWLLAGPVWIATGLLGPIVVGFPLQLIGSLIAGDSAELSSENFLEPWVFTVVYGGFILQAFALGTLFVLYAVKRWGGLAAGRVSDLMPTPSLPALRITAVAAAVLALIPLTMESLWASGSVAGLSDSMAEDRGRDQLLAQAANIPFTVAAAAGILILAFRLGRLPLRAVLALTWIGSSAMAAWGAWMLLTSLAATAVNDQATPVMSAVYAAQLLVGMLIGVAGMHFLADRSAATS